MAERLVAGPRRDLAPAGLKDAAIRIAILDDYQNAARAAADWQSLPDAELRVFDRPLGEETAVVEALRPFEVIVAMRERTPFPASLLDRLPALRLLVTTGMRSAYLIKTSRGGPIVDEAALVDALRAGRIAGAGLDVYDVEPLPADHPLRRLDNAVLTGHTGYVVQEMYQRAYGQAVEDIRAWHAGAPLRVLSS